MKLEAGTRATMFWGFAFFSAIWLTLGTLAVNIKQRTSTAERLPATPKIHAVQLNQGGLINAKDFIRRGNVVAAVREACADQQLTPTKKNSSILLNALG